MTLADAQQCNKLEWSIQTCLYTEQQLEVKVNVLTASINSLQSAVVQVSPLLLLALLLQLVLQLQLLLLLLTVVHFYW
jgi:hypothetical protein